MRTILVISLALAFGVATGSAAAQGQRGSVDDRYGIASVVPKSWTLQPPDPKLNGTMFTSPDRDAWLALYKAPAGRSVNAHMDSVAFRAGERITYQKRARDWIVVSGYKGDRIFYRRAMLACGNSNWHTVWFEYPANEKRAFDRLVTRASHALKMHRNDNCGPATG